MTPNQREKVMVHHGIISGAVIITLASRALSNASTFLKQKQNGFIKQVDKGGITTMKDL